MFKFQNVIFESFPGMQRTVEAGMSAKLVVHGSGAGIGYGVMNPDAVLSQCVSQLQVKCEGIVGTGFRRVGEDEGSLLLGQNRYSKVCVPAEAVFGNGVDLAI